MSANGGRAGFASVVRYVWLPLFLILGGCGGPSGSDIKRALQETSNGLLGTQMAPAFEDVSNVDCREVQGKPGYVCSFRATSFIKMLNQRSSETGEARFIQENSKWVMMADK